MGTLAGIMASAYSGRGASEAPWAASVHVDGATITTNQLLPGLAGAYDATTNVNRVYLSAVSATTLTGGSLWSAVIKGSAATLKLSRASGVVTNAVYASVDGGAFAALTGSGTNPTFSFPLFSGLSDDEHFVVVRIGSGFGIDQMYFDKTLNDALTITGTATYIEQCNQWVYPGVSNALAVASGMTVAMTANFTPNRSKQNILTGTSNIGMARIRGKFRSIQVANTGLGFTKIYVSKDGAAPTEYTSSDIGTNTYRVTGLTEETATYSVWTNNVDCSVFAVSGDADHVTIGTQKQLHQFGDSITYGGGSVPVVGAVDALRVAASMGYAGLTAGVGGSTIAQLETALPTYLAALTVTSDDVAILAIGRNDVASGISAAEATDFGDCIALLVAKGYGKIIVRGVLPKGDGTNAWTTENAALEAVVTALANPDVVWCDVSACPTYTTQASDTTHPDVAGYATIAAFVEPLYRTILGL